MENVPNEGAAASAHGRHGHSEEVVVVTEVVVVEDGEIVEEIIDIEEYVRSGRTPHPRARGYMVRVDKQKYLFDRAKVNGRDVLEKAGKLPPEKYILRQVLKGGALEKVELDQKLDLALHSIEKFKTMLKNAQDGLA